MLYDFYSSLLTDKQKDYMEMYYREDYSLGEIAEVSSVSRQAIYDNIRRTEQVLETYEEKLHLYEKFTERKALFTTLTAAIESKKSKDNILHVIKQLENIG